MLSEEHYNIFITGPNRGKKGLIELIQAGPQPSGEEVCLINHHPVQRPGVEGATCVLTFAADHYRDITDRTYSFQLC